MQLSSIPENPVPGAPALVEVLAQDGVRLRAAHWQPSAERRVRGTVCILQGRAEFIEKYFETVAELRQRGFAVVAFDWRGQGGSDRALDNPRKGHVSSFAAYRRDLEAVRDQILAPLMPQPYFALAHSMGAAVALGEASGGRLPFVRLVATSPMIAFGVVRRPDLAARTAWLLRMLGFGAVFVPGGGETSHMTAPFAGNPLTSDPRRYARNAVAAATIGTGAVGDPTIAWVDAAFRFMRKLSDPGFPRRIHVPTLIVAAAADRVCATAAIERFAAHLPSGDAIVLPGARHEILMERDEIRAEFWAAFDAFIPGTADPGYGSAVSQESKDRVVEPAVAEGDD